MAVARVVRSGAVSLLAAIALAAAGPGLLGMASGDDVAPLRVRLSPSSPVLAPPGPIGPGTVSHHPLTIHNDGVEPFTAVLSVDATDPDGLGLADALRLEARVTGGGCDQKSFDDAATLAAASRLAGFRVAVPSTVAPGDDVAVCLRLSLPPTAGNRYQGAGTDAVVRVVAIGG